MAAVVRVLSEAEAPLGSFHDCHVHGIRWRRESYAFVLDLQYITEWIEPTEASGGNYTFLVAEARLVFHNASGMVLSMDWARSALDAQIDEVNVIESRPSPNGLFTDRKFEIVLFYPDADMTIWSTGYEVQLLQEPVLSEYTWLPQPAL